MSERFTISGGDVSGYRVIDVDTGYEVTGAVHRDSEPAYAEARWFNEGITESINRAAEHDITLEPGQFKVIDGDLFLDGMVPSEWIDAMTMD